MTQPRSLGHIARKWLLAATFCSLLVAGMVGMGALKTAHASTLGDNIASIANGQIGGTCGMYYGCPDPGEWCADFARWVWSHAGADTSGLNGAASSFWNYGQKHGTLSSTPHVGDAVVFGYSSSSNWASHVALVTSVNTTNHTIYSVGGNERGGAGVVAQDGPYNWTVGNSWGGTWISGYISPVGSGSSGGGGSSAVPAPPGGYSAQSGYTAPTATWWVSTFANAPGYGSGGAWVGTLYAGTNYVFCKQWGNTVSDSSGNYNQWWLWTDLDTGGQGWVSAYYLSNWGNDIAKDNSGVVIPTCYPGEGPQGLTTNYGTWWVNTFANAPGYYGGGSNWHQDGTLYAATNYVFCRTWGPKVSDSYGNYNHWWMWTDLDTGGQGWVSAYYLSNWGNDVAKDNSGNDIPNC